MNTWDLLIRIVGNPELIMQDRVVRLKANGFMDLVVERHRSTLILAHYYEQNGDLMSDPRMDVQLDFEKKTAQASYFVQDNVAFSREGICKSNTEFLEYWLRNLWDQGFRPKHDVCPTCKGECQILREGRPDRDDRLAPDLADCPACGGRGIK